MVREVNLEMKTRFTNDTHVSHERYEEDPQQYVVRGPITTPRNIEEEETFTVATDDFTEVWHTRRLPWIESFDLSQWYNRRLAILGERN